MEGRTLSTAHLWAVIYQARAFHRPVACSKEDTSDPMASPALKHAATRRTPQSLHNWP